MEHTNVSEADERPNPPSVDCSLTSEYDGSYQRPISAVGCDCEEVQLVRQLIRKRDSLLARRAFVNDALSNVDSVIAALEREPLIEHHYEMIKRALKY